MDFPPAVEAWRPTVELIRERAIPIEPVLAWISEESNGNPCATGIIRDGRNVEAGIGQQYFEHPDSDVGGVTVGELRAACGGDPHNSHPVRPLTDDEKLVQVSALLSDIKESRDAATRQLAGIGAAWDVVSFWCLVKLQHGLPSIPITFLPLFARTHGRPPAAWGEWRDYVCSLSRAEIGEHSLAVARFCPLGRFFTNAERVGRAAG